MEFSTAFERVAPYVLGLECLDPSLTTQSGKDDADINVIVQRFGITGALPIIERPPLLSDCSDVPDFRTAQDIINAGRDAFMKLDAKVRARFANNPALFLDFVSVPGNEAELKSMGMLIAKEVPAKPAPMEVVVVSEIKPKD